MGACSAATSRWVSSCGYGSESAGSRRRSESPTSQPNGRFHTSFNFAPGNGVVRYWFSVSTLREADYAYAPGSSPTGDGDSRAGLTCPIPRRHHLHHKRRSTTDDEPPRHAARAHPLAAGNPNAEQPVQTDAVPLEDTEPVELEQGAELQPGELEPVEYVEDLHEQPIDAEPIAPRPRRWPPLLVVLAIAIGAVALGNRSGSPAPSTATPSGWLRAYMRSSVRSPERVCAQLLTPALERLFAQANGSCPGAYRNVNNSPYHVLRILRTGDTAAIELHWLPNVGYSTIVLNRQDGRWRAVDMIPGGHEVPHH